MQVNELISALEQLPAPQRRVLFPLLAWSIVRQAPEDVLIPEPLGQRLGEFIANLGPDERMWPQLIEEMLDEAGVTLSLLREIGAKVATATISPDVAQFLAVPKTKLEPQRAPRGQEARSGPGARFELMAKMTRSREG